MNDFSKLEENVKKIFFQTFPNMPESDFDWKKHQPDYENWDSFAQLQLITLAEETFGIKLDLEESISITSAEGLLSCVRSHL